MSKIALVTLDDMPPLALGEFQLSDDFETLFAGVGDVAEAGTGGGSGGGTRPNVPAGTSPVQIKSGVFNRLNIYAYSITANIVDVAISAKFSRMIKAQQNNISMPTISTGITLKEVN